MFAGVPAWFPVVSFGLFGLLFGSFANVVIWRVPRGESIASPGSHCPGCNTPIAWYDNVPIVSWLVLRGRCRACGNGIAFRYPLVEAVSGVLFVVAAISFGPTIRGIAAAVLFWFLLVLSAIDLDTMRLPNVIVGTLAIIGGIGVVASQMSGTGIVPLLDGASTAALSPLASAALGVLLGAGLSGGVAAAYAAIRGRGGLGMGDVKLLAVLGIFLGPYVLLCLFIASVFGALFGIAAAMRGGKLAEMKIPFGPWLALGGVITSLVGPSVVSWYLALAGLS